MVVLFVKKFRLFMTGNYTIFPSSLFRIIFMTVSSVRNLVYSCIELSSRQKSLVSEYSIYRLTPDLTVMVDIDREWFCA